jgi:hypothetical protein
MWIPFLNLTRQPDIHQAFDIVNEADLSDEELEAQEKLTNRFLF